MPKFRVPVDDYKFLFKHVFDMEANYKSLDCADDFSVDILEAILEEAAKFSENELAPLYQSGDEEGCTLKDGVVTTPSGFKEAYKKFIEGGWTSLTGEPELGGQGLPSSVSLAVNEMLTTANWAWAMYPGLSEGAVATLESHGTDQQKKDYLPKLIDGKWSGTMCLTEPHCGTDLGQMKTNAKPNDDGSFSVNGTKIFISAGEHDLTENIIHIVLAKLPDAPAGTKGLSLFIIPKFLTNGEGKIGDRNGVHCGAIEKKMGIHGNSTALLNFDNAKGFLIGEPHDGLSAMFTYMNVARIGTASQGVAAAERSYQGASAYAIERLAMRSLSGFKNPNGPADAIIEHPDVRRMLLTQRVIAEGGRAMITHASQYADLYRNGKSTEDRESAEQKLGFCTPILKGFITELGVEAANLGIQVYGGHGYIKEWGMEQIFRDSKIATLYEGTTGIQALDLIGRKVLLDKFMQLKIFSKEITKFSRQTLLAALRKGNKELFYNSLSVLRLAMKWRYLAYKVGYAARKNRDEAGGASVDFLMFSGYLYMAYMFLKMKRVSLDVSEEKDFAADFTKHKLHTAQFFFDKILPRADMHAKAIFAGSNSLMKMPVEYFA
tara:strand:- start:2289 stop:4103 length:1815 start_codon:yes stop_codon:yes gene_type:complete